MKHLVILMPVAEQAIVDHARWILDQSHSNRVAERWLSGVFRAVDSLETEPRSHPLAEEHGRRGVELRKTVIGGFTLLFTIDDASQKVSVVAAYGSGQRPPI